MSDVNEALMHAGVVVLHTAFSASPFNWLDPSPSPPHPPSIEAARPVGSSPCLYDVFSEDDAVSLSKEISTPQLEPPTGGTDDLEQPCDIPFALN